LCGGTGLCHNIVSKILPPFKSAPKLFFLLFYSAFSPNLRAKPWHRKRINMRLDFNRKERNFFRDFYG